MTEQVSQVGGKNLLLALFDIAYRSRLGLPLIVSAGLMFFDIQARIEIDVNIDVEQGEAAEVVDGEEVDRRDGRQQQQRRPQ